MKTLSLSIWVGFAFSFWTNFQLVGATVYWDGDGNGQVGGGTGTWNTTLSRWSTTPAGTSYQAWNNASHYDAVFGVAAGTVTVGTSIDVRSIVFQIGGYTIINSSGNSVYFSDNGTGVVDVLSGTNTISCVITGAVGLTKSGPGTLVLLGTNTFDGPINVFGGTLSIDDPQRLVNSGDGAITIDGATLRSTSTGSGNVLFVGDTHPIVIGASGGTLDVANSGVALFYNGVISGGVLTKSGAGEFRLGSTNAFTKLVVNQGAYKINFGTAGDLGFGAVPAAFLADAITLNSGAAIGNGLFAMTVHTNRGITLGAGGGTIDTATGTGTPLTLPSVISGSGALTKANSGTISLAGDNTFSGGLSILAGRINFDHNHAAGTGPITVTPSTAVTLRNNVSGVALANNIVLNPSSSTIDVVVPTGNTFNLNGVISGSANWNRGIGGGLGNLVLGGGAANTFSGLLAIRFGTVTAAKNGALGTTAAATTVLANGSLAFQNNVNYTTLEPVTISGTGVTNLFNGAINNPGGDNTFAGPITLAANSFIGSDAGSLNLSGTIGGAFELTKVGPAVLVLGGANTYGSTVVSNGTLKVANLTGSATGTGSVNVLTNTTLNGNGSISGPVTVSGTIAPGAGVGRINTGGETWNGGGHYAWEINDVDVGEVIGWDLVNINGSLTLNATPANKFVLDLASLTLAGAAGAVSDFAENHNYAWRIVSTTTGISGFDPNAFSFNTANFANALNTGVFTLAVNNFGKDLVLLFTLPAPTIVAQPQNQSAIAGNNATFTIATAAAYGFQWRKNGVNISGATAATLTIANVQDADVADYSVVLTNVSGTTVSAAGHLTVLHPPLLTLQPQSQTVGEGANVTFSAAATGTTPLSFQWRFNGVDLNGETNPTLTIANVQHTQAGNYSVRVTNVAGAAISDPAVLTVHFPPIITSQPQSISVTNGDAVSLNVVAIGTAPLSYQWRFNGADLNGESSPAISVINAGTTNEGTYTVLVTNTLGAVTSTVATLTLVRDFGDAPDPTYPTLLASDGARHLFARGIHLGSRIDVETAGQPGAGALDDDGVTLTTSVVPGQTTALLVVASTNGLLDAWMDFNQNGSWAEVGEQIFTNQVLTVGTNSLSFSVPETALSGTNAYARFRFSSSGTVSFTGEAADGEVEDYRFSINAPADLAVLAVASPDPVAVGSNLTYTITVTNLGPSQAVGVTLTNWVPESVSFVSVAASQGSCEVSGGTITGALGMVAAHGSAVVTIVVTPTASGTITNVSQVSAIESDPDSANNGTTILTTVNDPPVVTTPPASQTIVQGSPVTFGVTVGGTGPFAYQWRFNSTNLPGETNPTLTIGNVQPVHAGNYSVRVISSVGTTLSDSAVLTVLEPPTILAQPQSRTNVVGTVATFTVFAGGTSPFAYQWYFNESLLPDAITATLTLSNVQTNQAGNYQIVVTTSLGVVTSAVATLTVQELDYGDAPDPAYPTLLANDGARHVIVPGFFLGTNLDAELDGQPNGTATGDDNTSATDEDGVRFITALFQGHTATTEVVASAPGKLDAWIDFNADGDWADAGEQVFTSQPLDAGTNVLNFAVPTTAAPSNTFARFRFSSVGGLSYSGQAPDGEVEDYQVSILALTPYKLTILNQPSATAVAGVAFAPQPVLRVEDEFGELVAADTNTVVTATREDGAGTLQGTLTAKAVNGIVTFTNLSHRMATNITIRFSSGGLLSTTSSVVAISPAAASKLVLHTPPPEAVIAGVPFPQQPVLFVTDAFGNLRPDDNGTIVTAAVGFLGSATLQGTLTATTVNGVATFTNLSYNVSEFITIAFTSSSLAPATADFVYVFPAAAAKLVFTTQPDGAVAGSPFGTQPVVQTTDQFGNLSSDGLPASRIVAVALSTGTGPLQGTTNLDIGTNAGNGVVTFTNLRIDTGGANKVLTASATGLTNALSAQFAVSAGAFTKLQVLLPGESSSPGSAGGKTGTPSAQTADTSFNVTVNAVDAFWNLITTASDTVGLSSTDANATLAANQALVSGTKAMSVSLTTPGTWTVTASDVTDPAKSPNTSSSLTIGVPVYVSATGGGAISADTTAGTYTTLTGPIYSEAVNKDVGLGTIIFNAPAGFEFAGPVTAAVTRLDTGSQALLTLSSTITVTATTITTTVLTQDSANGGTKARARITWSGIKVRPSAGTPLARGNITRTGTASLAGVSSAANFGTLKEVSGLSKKLIVVTQPAAVATAGAAFNPQPVIGIADQFGNVRSSANGTPDNSAVVTAARSAGTGTLQGTLTATATNGAATFTNLFHTVANTITLNFTNSTLTNVTSANVIVNPTNANQLVFTTQPDSVVVGAPFGVQPVIVSRDPYGNSSAVGFPGTLNLTMTLSLGTGPLLGTTTLNIGTNGGNGTANFTDLRVGSGGPINQLTASVPGLPSISSSNFSTSIGNQTISFPALSNRVYGEVFTATASASSGLPVSLEILSGPATNSGNLITITGIGAVTIRATQAGDATYNAATPVTNSFTAAKANVAMAISSSANPSGPAQEVTFTATITAAAPGNGNPSGSAQFTTNGSPLGGALTLTSGSASIPAPLSQHGTNTITVAYNGDDFFNGSTNALSPPQMVNVLPVAAGDAVECYAGRGVKLLAASLLANDTDADGDTLAITGVNSNSAAGGTVRLLDNWVFYLSPAGATNADSFVYQVTDAFGGTAQGMVLVTVMTNAAAGDNFTIADLGNGSFRVSFDGMPGQIHEVQYTATLENPDWQTLATRTADSLGRYEYVDTPPGGVPRIYRSIAP